MTLPSKPQNHCCAATRLAGGVEYVLGDPPLLCSPFPSDSVDNSEYMRNGDFLPTRLQAQQDAVNIVCHSKTRSNPENNVGLITLAKYVGSRSGAVKVGGVASLGL